MTRGLRSVHRVSWVAFVLALSLLAVGCFGRAADGRLATAEPPVLARFEATVAHADESPQFSGDSAWRHVEALAGEIGSRPAGSDNQNRAARYIYDQFAALGYQTELQRFPVTFYDDRGATVTVGGALGPAIRPMTLTYSAAGTADGPLADAGLARAGELAPGSLAGKVALIRRGEIQFSEKVRNVAAAGAVGAIIYNHVPGRFAGSLVSASEIPAVGVSDEEGQLMLDLLRAGPVDARLVVDASTETKEARNVVATRPGGSRTVVIGSHFDSVSAGPGANDNASGTATILELARVLAARPTPFTLKLVAFDAEEIGLRGSAHMVSQMSEAERRAIVAMINLDMVGVGGQPLFGGSDQLKRIAFPIAARLGQPAQSMGDASGGSDHAPFLRADIPALFIFRSNDPNYHSPNDRAEYVDPGNLEFAGQVVLGVLDALASGD